MTTVKAPAPKDGDEYIALRRQERKDARAKRTGVQARTMHVEGAALDNPDAEVKAHANEQYVAKGRAARKEARAKERHDAEVAFKKLQKKEK